MLKDFNQKARKALSWMFNNNGNEVDYTRLRIDDGTRLFSTGIHRLKDDKPLLASSSLCLALVILDQVANNGKMTPELVPNFIVSTLLAEFYVKITGFSLKLKFNNKCLNTKATSPTNTMDFINAEDERKCLLRSGLFEMGGAAFFIAVSATNIVSETNDTFTNTLANTLAILKALSGTYNLCSAYRFNKVLKGDWTIEDKPPPQEKKPKENKASILEKLVPTLTPTG